MQPETNDQIALVKWISSSLLIPEVRAGHGDAGYLLRNMVAKYSLGASEYEISESAFKQMISDGIDLTARYNRAKFYGKKQVYIYEHTIPASVIRNKLLAINATEEAVRDVLQNAGGVAVILRSEDEALNALNLRHRMPQNWHWGDNPLARYTQAAISLSGKKLQVSGKIKR